jgi:hypothetical protein
MFHEEIRPAVFAQLGAPYFSRAEIRDIVSATVAPRGRVRSAAK